MSRKHARHRVVRHVVTVIQQQARDAKGHPIVEHVKKHRTVIGLLSIGKDALFLVLYDSVIKQAVPLLEHVGPVLVAGCAVSLIGAARFLVAE